jgi:ATP-dependent DNA ligase
MSVRESGGSEEWWMGPGLDEGKDGGLPVGEASAGRTVRILEWTGDNHFRHTRFIGLREDNNARDVGRE